MYYVYVHICYTIVILLENCQNLLFLCYQNLLVVSYVMIFCVILCRNMIQQRVNALLSKQSTLLFEFCLRLELL